MSNYDNETNDGLWEETDDDTEINDPIYEPEEQSLTKYNIVLCERYNRNIHGNVDGVINNHYLTLIRFIELDLNFINLLNCPTNAKLEIAECLYLPSEHCVSILKTYWLKLIQRTWKKNCRIRKSMITMRSHPNALAYREIHGKWPNNCANFPSLSGMLSNLSRTSSRTISSASS